MVDFTIQLPECRQGRRSHPHDEVLILVAVVFRIFWIQLIDALVPVRWLDGVLEGWMELMEEILMIMIG